MNNKTKIRKKKKKGWGHGLMIEASLASARP
jgi:hypothetical protein